MVDIETRRRIYLKAPTEIRALYDSETTNELNDQLVEKYQITEDKRGVFLDVTGDVILGFHKIAELPRLLQKQVGLSQEDAKRLTSELIDAWGPVVEREAAEAKAKKDEVASLADKIAAIGSEETAKSQETDAAANDSGAEADTAGGGLEAQVRAQKTHIATDQPKNGGEANEQGNGKVLNVNAEPVNPKNSDPEQGEAEQNTGSLVKPIRTMAADADRAHGYGAQTSAATPSSEADDEPVIKAAAQDELRPSSPASSATPSEKEQGKTTG